MSMLKERYSGLAKTERRIFWILLIASILLGIFAASGFNTFLHAPNLQIRIGYGIPAPLAVIAFVCALLIFFGRNAAASWLLIIGYLFGILATVSQAEGYGIPAGFVLLAIALSVPRQLTKGRTAAAAMAAGMIGTLAIILVDTFWSLPRVPVSEGEVNFARAAAVVLGFIVLLTVALQFRDFSIRSKLLILALGTGLISIVLIASASTIFTQEALRAGTRNSLAEAARHSIEKIDSYIEFSTHQIQSDAQLPAVIAYLKATPKVQDEQQEEVLALFNALAQSDPLNIGSYALLSRGGVDLVDTYTDDIGLNESDRDYFIEPMTNGVTFVSPVRYSPTSSDHAFDIAAPVFDVDGSILGVLRVRYRASVLQQILGENNGIAGEESFGILLDEQNIILANGNDSTWISRTLIPIEPGAYDRLRAENRLLDSPPTKLSLDMPLFSSHLQQLSAQQPFFVGSDAAWGSLVDVAVANSSLTSWKVAYVQPQAISLQIITRQNQLLVSIALVTGLLIALAGFLVANTITKPILALTTTAEQIAGGDFSARASVQAKDEINSLAVSFNMMTDHLKDTLGNLEQRVAERTADLDMARLLSDRRAGELQHISEISRIISSEQKLDTLLSMVTRLVSDKFDFYHTGIFLIDDTRQYAVLQAANSEGGQNMLARGHRLEVGHTGIVGNVAQTGLPRAALDVGSDAVYFDNPDLPRTRSEMALPLIVRGITIGVLDVQSTKPGAFTESDVKNLSILADQIAIAIDNARLFGQNRQALAEVQSLYNQYLRQEWLTFNRQETQVGYIQSSMGGRPLHRPTDSEEIRLALQQGSVVVVEGQGEKSVPAIVVPVRLRGQTIGVLDIKAPTQNRRWSPDEIKLAQAISDRLALALDNARLLIESQRQTAKEQKIGEVTAKIGASINMRNVLQTAVEELGRALPGSEVIIQFNSNGKQANDV